MNSSEDKEKILALLRQKAELAAREGLSSEVKDIAGQVAKEFELIDHMVKILVNTASTLDVHNYVRDTLKDSFDENEKLHGDSNKKPIEVEDEKWLSGLIEKNRRVLENSTSLEDLEEDLPW